MGSKSTTRQRRIAAPSKPDDKIPPVDESPNPAASPVPPLLGRLIGVVVAGAAVSGLFWNHHVALTQMHIYLGIVLFCPILAGIGFGCAVDPRMWWAFGDRAVTVPRWVRVMARILAFVGVAVAAYLALSVYHIQTAHQVIKPHG